MLNYVLIGNTLTKSIIAKVHNQNLGKDIENYTNNSEKVFLSICQDLQKFSNSNSLSEDGINYFYNISDNLLVLVLLEKNEEKKFTDFLNEVKSLQINPDIINNSPNAKVNLESELLKLITKYSNQDSPVTQTENNPANHANSEIRLNLESDRSIIHLAENTQARRVVKSNNTRLIIIIVFIVIGIILAIVLPTVIQSRPRKN
jgi:hypothetical protein